MATMSYPIDLRDLLRPYKGEWVALSHDEKRVLGHGKTIDDALAGAMEKAPNERPVMIKVPSEGAGFVII